MYKRVENKKGITLISLVVTIIILLIIAGIAISVLTGEDGIISKTELAKKKYEISEAKEKLEFAIENLRIEQEGKGEELRRENLPKLNNNEIDVGSVEAFPVEVICGGYKFSVDENFVVTYLGEANRTIITYTTNPEGYTNQDEIQILIKIKNDKGIKEIKYPNDTNELVAYGKTEVGIDYKVTANGTYTFKVIDNENDEVVKDIVIDKIDKLEPLDFTPEVIKNGNSITIKENGKDAEPDGISTKSGIDYYEYYLKAEKETEYTKYETNVITNLSTGVYDMYAIVYDKAGNKKQSNGIRINIRVPFKEIKTGMFSYTVAIDENGNLFTWGINFSGQLGDGTTTNRYSPKQIQIGTKFNKISLGSEHCLAIDEKGKLWAWGKNSNGQLGDGTKTDQKMPIQIIKDETFIQITADEQYSLALDSKGYIWSWGYNKYGQLGDGTSTDHLIPIKINSNVKFKDVKVGNDSVLALDNNGNLWTWGKNYYGSLGNGILGNSMLNTSVLTPTQITNGIVFEKIDKAADGVGLAVDENGNLWTWGTYLYGCLGEDINENKTKPTQIMKGIVVKDISAGNSCMCIDTEGNLWTWGRNRYGELGNGTKGEQSSVPIKIMEKINVNKISMNYGNAFIIDSNKRLWAWGSNSCGMFGNEETTDSYVPILIE